MSEGIIPRLIELEKDVRYQEFASDTEHEYLHVAGKIPVLISAPHGAVHTRDGKCKEEDEYTAGFARLIGERTKGHILYSRRKSKTDPNADPQAPYKKYLEKIVVDNKIKFVVDLHGANANKTFGVALGMLHGESCTESEKEAITKAFEKYGFSESKKGLSRLDVDNEFPAEGNENRVPITRFCHSISVSAVQIEINAHLRIPTRREDATNHASPFEGKPELIENTIMALSDVVLSLANLD